MAGRVQVTTKLRPAAFAAIDKGLASGMDVAGRRTIERTQAPDAPPIGAGLVDTGAWGVFVNGRKVAGEQDPPPQVQPGPGVTLIVAYGFPARFQEFGTVRQPARPFLTPAMDAIMPSLVDIIRGPVNDALRTVK